MTNPTPGRIVSFRANGDHRLKPLDATQPLAAMIVHVHDAHCVNLVVFDSLGQPHPREGVPLLQEGDVPPPEPCSFAEWTPYQKGQAAKTEQLAQKLAGDGAGSPPGVNAAGEPTPARQPSNEPAAAQ